MKLSEAIENRIAYLKNSKIPKSTDDYNATLLLIEAGKWRLLMEHDYGSWCGPLLPGETK